MMLIYWLRSVRYRVVKFTCFVSFILISIYVISSTYIQNYIFTPVAQVKPLIHKSQAIRYRDIAINVSRKSEIKLEEKNKSENNIKGRTKYILLWTNQKDSPFVYFGSGQNVFVTKKCKWNNCYVTADRNYLGLYTTEFDAILFHGPRLQKLLDLYDTPTRRSNHQKYVYANIESSVNYPVQTNLWNGFFNWTWTYRLDSDSVWGYFAIRNATHHVIGPSRDIRWISLSDMEPIDSELIERLRTKTKAVAWFSSNCYTMSKREYFVRQIDSELRRYGLKVDIYGTCGNLHCPRSEMDRCLDILEKDYLFYFAFENALSEDYVTEKIVYALNHNTVPVVYGGANYSRFMPDGIYLDAFKLGPKRIAKIISDLIDNPQQYYELFKWKKHYSYHFRSESPDTDDYCHFCQVLHDKGLMETVTVYDNLDVWWTTNFSKRSFYHDDESVEINYMRV